MSFRYKTSCLRPGSAVLFILLECFSDWVVYVCRCCPHVWWITFSTDRVAQLLHLLPPRTSDRQRVYSPMTGDYLPASPGCLFKSDVRNLQRLIFWFLLALVSANRRSKVIHRWRMRSAQAAVCKEHFRSLDSVGNIAICGKITDVKYIIVVWYECSIFVLYELKFFPPCLLFFIDIQTEYKLKTDKQMSCQSGSHCVTVSPEFFHFSVGYLIITVCRKF